MYADLTRACARCMLRLRATHPRCPRCLGAALCDPGELPSRWPAPLRGVNLPSPPANGEWELDGKLVGWLVGTISAAAAVVRWMPRVSEDASGLAALPGLYLTALVAIVGCVGGVSCAWAGGLLGALLGAAWASISGARRRSSLPRVGVERFEAADRGGLETLSARVVGAVSTPVTSPLEGRACVAFRLTGRVGDFAVDDADAVAFVVETHDGRRALVEPSRAALALPTGPGRSLRAGAHDALRAFLSARGIRADVDGAALWESTLAEGDALEIEGALDLLDAEGAYRDVATLVLRDREARPLTIRRA